MVDKNGWFVLLFGEWKLDERNKEEDWEEREEGSKRSGQTKRRRELEEQGGNRAPGASADPGGV